MHETTNHLLRYRAAAHSDRAAIVFQNRTVTYRELNGASDAAATLLKQNGINRNDRFAILDFNNPDVVSLWLGAAKIGAVPVLVNWRFTPTETKYIVEESESKLFFYGEPFRSLVEQSGIDSLPRFPIESVAEAKDSGEPFPVDLAIDRDSVLIQLYTSGTTGYPRGVLLTHGSMLTMVSGVAMELPGFGADARNLIVAPLFNIAGAGYTLLGLHTGATNVLFDKFDPTVTARAIDEHEITNVFLAPAMIAAILALPDIDNYSFASLRNIHYGGSPMPEPLLRNAKERFGCYFLQGYGLTETSGITTVLRFDDHEAALFPGATPEQKRILQSAGRPVYRMEIKIEKEDGTRAAPEEIGEVCIRGDNLTDGYWKKPEFLDGDGWFRSGDIGTVDNNGYLYLLDRKNDMIVSGGINIYPAEIERVLVEHPQIRDVAVIGIPDEKFGERLCAVIVPGDEAPTLESLRSWAKERMAGYRVPSELEIKTELPRNPSGKVLRRELREPYWRGKERQI